MCYLGCDDCVYLLYYNRMCDDIIDKIEINLYDEDLYKYVEHYIQRLIYAYKNIKRGSYEKSRFIDM
jgi:hypothetical protein